MSETQTPFPADGGPAFPEVPGPENGYENRPGMSLRDYFAGQALQGFVSSPNIYWPDGCSDAEVDRLFAQKSYEMADVMLAARKGGAA
jgi:hypothetical protein